LERVGVEERVQTIEATSGAGGWNTEDLVSGDGGRTAAG
jgi:hypothetical protein